MKRISFPFNFGDIFVLIPLNISDIEAEEDSDTNESENFNINIQIYLTFKREYEEFIIIRVNLNTVNNNGEKHLYNKDNLYLKFNNVKYNGII